VFTNLRSGGRVRTRRTAAVSVGLALALVLTAAGCREAGSGTSTATTTTPGGTSAAPAAAGSFGELTNVCQSGTAKGATAQGVTDTSIATGTMSDFGFTKNREFLDAAEGFSAWCNDAGGINGRKLTPNPRDTNIAQYRQRVLEACKEDFALVGGGAAFDDSGLNDRLTCLLPDFPAQVVGSKNRMSDLQVISYANFNPKISPYESWFKWLTSEKYPDSKDHVGLIVGDAGVTKTIAQQTAEVLDFLGATVVYNEVYPIQGASDWTPYAQAIKENGVKGLVFYGEYAQLAKLEQSLGDINYQLDWIDANANSYNKEFLELTGASLDSLNNVVPSGIAPLEKPEDNPSVKQLTEIMAKYKPGVTLTQPMVNAWSAWLLFSQSARDCGAGLTRKCVLEKAGTVTEWTAGGLHAPTNPASKDPRQVCFIVEQASSEGWKAIDSGANKGIYNCSDAQLNLTGDYGKPTTLADVGKNISELQ
jgi:ABC-type branched-subunit amino acid transport system substrate-binding protein